MLSKVIDPAIKPGSRVLKEGLLYDICVWDAPTSHSGYWRTVRGVQLKGIWKLKDEGFHVEVIRGYQLMGR